MKKAVKWVRQWLAFPIKQEIENNNLQIENNYRQIESLMGVYSLLNSNFAIGPLRGWAISPDNLQIVLTEISKGTVQTVVEFGSGESTIAIAKLLANTGGKLFTVEHDAEYHQRIRERLDLFGLSNIVQSIVRPLVSQSIDETTYDMSEFPSLSPDVVLIDGPPGGKKNRLAPLFWAYRNLREDGTIYLDDYNRSEERNCVSQLKLTFPDACVTEIYTEKQLAVIRNPKMK